MYPINDMPPKRARRPARSGGLRPPTERPQNGHSATQSNHNNMTNSAENSTINSTDEQAGSSSFQDSIHPNRPATPDPHVDLSDKSSSELSSIPTSIGSTPAGLISPERRRQHVDATHQSPTRRSERTRRQTAKSIDYATVEPALKRSASAAEPILSQAAPDTDGRVSLENSNATPEVLSVESSRRSSAAGGLADPVTGVLPSVEETPETKEFHHSHGTYQAETDLSPEYQGRETRASRKRKAVESSENDVGSKDTKRPRLSTDEGYKSRSPVPAASQLPRGAKTARPSAKKKAIVYGAEGQAQHGPTPTESTRRSGRNINRGGAKAGRGNASNGRGRGNKARGRGRDDDSPEPPMPKRPQSQEDILTIKHIKARQAELRRFFHVVGSQQSDILDMISSRDLTRLVKKAKAHKQVPEYEELVADLEASRIEVEDLASGRYTRELEAENRRYEAEKKVIEERCQVTIRDLQDEYTKGAQGDLMLFRRAVAAAFDETGTQDGSEIGYIPHYHECPEPDAKLRGFVSNRITDEKPFKHHPLTYDDEARRDVIEDDVSPIIQAFAQKNAERRAEEERRKTQTMEALSAEADRQLKDMDARPIENPTQTDNRTSWALSCLADVAEWRDRRPSQKQYNYTPPEDRERLPQEVLTYDKFPRYGPALPPPSTTLSHPLTESGTSMQRAILSKPQPSQGTRRSLRNLQPNVPLNQPQMYHAPATHATPVPATPAMSSGAAPAIAPAPPKLTPGPPTPSGLHPRPPLLDTRPPVTRSEGPSPSHQSSAFPQPSPVHGLPPLQPRHAPHTSLPPPPPYSIYPQQFSPTYPPQSYPPPPLAHHMPVASNHVPPPPSPYHQQPPNSPYSQQTPQPYHSYGHPLPPPPPLPSASQKQQQSQQQQQYSFLPPQQGPTPPHFSPTLPRPHSRSRSHAASPGQALDPFRPSNLNQNGYHSRSSSTQFLPQHQPQSQPPKQAPAQPLQASSHHHTPSHGHSHTHSHSHSHDLNHNLGLGINTNIPPQSQPPSTTTSSPVVTATTATPAKSRGKSKGKQSVTFVNQTQATRKAALEHAAREEADRAAEKKERKEKGRERGSTTGTDKSDSDTKGRKLAPKM